MLLRIEAPHFVAGLEVQGRLVWRAAPICHYMVGWRVKKVLAYCQRKQWAVKRVARNEQ